MLHILTPVICFISGIFLPTDLSMLLFSCLLFTVYHVIIIYTLFICTSTFSFSYTLIGLLLTTLDLDVHIGCFLLLIRCLMSPYALRGVLSFSTYPSIFIFLFIPMISIVSWFHIYQLHYYFIPFSSPCVDIYIW